MRKPSAPLLFVASLLSGCSLAPDFKLPETSLPKQFKEQSATKAPEATEQKGSWKKAEALENEDRGQWWKIFGDEHLNDLEKQAADANQTLKVATARVIEARGTAESNTSTFLPDLSIGGNAVRTQPANASLAAFGQPSRNLKPYTLYQGQGVLSYEADLFGRVRDNYKAFKDDAEAEEAVYRSVLLTLQADVAQNYFALRALDSERQLLRDTITIREKAARIMQHKFDVGEAGEQDLTRTISELASSKADLFALDRQRSILEHALAVLLGKMPSEFSFAEYTLEGPPPEIPPGLPSSLLMRRPDIASAQFTMAAANARIGVARSAFFPSINLTATGGFESTELSNLFHWSNRTWALGQLADSAISMPIFDSGRLLAKLDVAHAAYDEAVANYRQQVLIAFQDVEDNLASQKLLAEQSKQQDTAASASTRTTEVIQKRYHEGDVDFFEVVNAERDSLAASRLAVQVRGQRFATTIALIRALGGGWDDVNADSKPSEPKVAELPKPIEKPDEKAVPSKEATKPTPLGKPVSADKPEATVQKAAPVTPVEITPAKGMDIVPLATMVPETK